MRRTLGLVLLLSPAVGLAQNDNPVLSDPGEPHATLDFRATPTAGALMVVRPLQIGSRNVANQSRDRRTWWIRPGEHSIRFAATSTPTGSGSTARARRGRGESNTTLTMTLEAGLRYNVAGVGMTDGTWTPVVWRITDEASGEVLFDLIEDLRRTDSELRGRE